MMTRQYAAWLAMPAIYDDAGRGANFDQLLTIGVDMVGIKTVPEANAFTITPEGTHNALEWISNFTWVPAHEHPVWGSVHLSFYEVSLAIFNVVKPLALDAIAKGHDVYIQGHSRGGTLADALAAHFAIHGIKVTISMFEAANFGCQQYSDWANRMVAAGLITVTTSTRNGIDPVVLVPPPLWVRTYPKYDLELNAAPGGLEDIDPIDWHLWKTVYPGYLKMFPA